MTIEVGINKYAKPTPMSLLMVLIVFNILILSYINELSEFLTHTTIIHIYSIVSSDIPQYIVVFALCRNCSGRSVLNTLKCMLLSNVTELLLYTI